MKRPKIWIIIALILLASTMFCFLIFETGVIYDVDIGEFDNITKQLRRPISVSEIKLSVKKGEGDAGDSGGNVGDMPGNSKDDIRKDSDGDGKLVRTICKDSLGVYDGQTRSGSARYVDVTSEYKELGANAKGGWYTRLSNSVTHAANMKISKRATGGPKVVNDNVVTNADGIPLCAVGPRIISDSLPVAWTEDFGESLYNYPRYIDVVLNKDGTDYYIPFEVVDCKAHTWPNGKLQTGYKVSKGTLYFSSGGESDNHHVVKKGNISLNDFSIDISNHGYPGCKCPGLGTTGHNTIEIVSVASYTELKEYTIKGVWVYDK